MGLRAQFFYVINLERSGGRSENLTSDATVPKTLVVVLATFLTPFSADFNSFAVCSGPLVGAPNARSSVSDLPIS
jgi:hypothetical protein